MGATETIPLDPHPADADIIAQIRAGDIDAFATLMRRHSRRLYRVAVSVVGNEDEAEEIVQDAFVRTYTHLGQFQGRAQFSTWLTRIAFHAALARKQARRRFLDVDAESDAHEALFHHSVAPERELLRQEIGRQLSASLARLPKAYRDCITLVYFEELSRSAAAAVLKITRANLKVRLHRARRMLQGQLQRSHASRPATRVGC